MPDARRDDAAHGSTPRQLALLLASYAALAWVLSSALSRGQGFVFFIGLGALLVPALAAFRRGHRRALYGLWFCVLLSSCGGVALEAVLWLAPGVLRGRIADVAYTGYHWQRGGIYALDSHAGPVLRPGVERRMYWAGHWWTHATNPDGYRGPRLERAAAVFLGDSVIYGHGVEETQAVPARHAARTGRASANLGQQGTSLVQSFLTFRRIGVRLRPERVFVCFHYNDVEETLRDYDPGQLQRFVDSPVGQAELPLVQAAYSPKPWWSLPSLWSRHVAVPMRAGGILGEVVRLARAGELGRRSAGERWTQPSRQEIDRPFPPASTLAAPAEALAWRAQARSLVEIQAIAAGARVVVLDVGWPSEFSQAVERLAGSLGLDYVPAGRVAIARAQAGEPMFLENDGHWSPQGCDAVAEALAQRVAEGMPLAAFGT